MAWYTDLYTTITFTRETFNSLYRVESEIETSQNTIDHIEKELLSLAVMTEPQKYCPEDENTASWVQHSVANNLEILKEQYIRLYQLELLRDSWDECHDENGLAIPPPEGMDKSYLDGDYIEKTQKTNHND